MLSSVAEIIRDLLIFVVAMTALLIVLLVVISKLPDKQSAQTPAERAQLPRRGDGGGWCRRDSALSRSRGSMRFMISAFQSR